MPDPKVIPVSGMAREIWDENHPEVTRLKHHYERKGFAEWNNDRISALAKRMNITLWVLFATCGVFTPVYDKARDLRRLQLDKALIKRCWKANAWPVTLAIEFDRLEKFMKLREGAKFDDFMIGDGDFIQSKTLAKV